MSQVLGKLSWWKDSASQVTRKLNSAIKGGVKHFSIGEYDDILMLKAIPNKKVISRSRTDEEVNHEIKRINTLLRKHYSTPYEYSDSFEDAVMARAAMCGDQKRATFAYVLENTFGMRSLARKIRNGNSN